MYQPNSLLNLTNLVQFCLLNNFLYHYEIIWSTFLKYCEYYEGTKIENDRKKVGIVHVGVNSQNSLPEHWK
jgi:hypothetical protein